MSMSPHGDRGKDTKQWCYNICWLLEVGLCKRDACDMGLGLPLALTVS